MMQKILPTAVLTLVCAVVCALLALAHMVTRDRIEAAEIEKVQKSLASVFGEKTYTALDTVPEGVTAVYRSSDGLTIYDITADGYARGGLRVLTGLSPDGRIAGVGIVSCGETAGIGTSVTEESYLSCFTGAADEAAYPDAISGATFSSGGLHRAVALAQASYAKEEHDNG